MDKWDGSERRNDNYMRDILIELRNDVKHLVSGFDDHVKEDKENFKWIFRIMWAGGGIISFVLIAIKFIN